jgi:hypothetical protein
VKSLLPLAAAAAACFLVACDGGGKTIEADELKRLVLQPEDVPAVFVRFDEGRQLSADMPGGARSEPARFGREDGWKARYRRRASPSTPGPVVIESRADAFGSAGGADKDLDTYRREFTGPSEAAAGRLLRAPYLGAEAFAATFEQGSGQFGVRFFLVAWRDKNVTASVLAQGFARKISFANALSLAQKQQRRIAVATE